MESDAAVYAPSRGGETDDEATAIHADALRLAENGDLSVAALIGVVERLRALSAADMASHAYQHWILHNAAHPLAYAVRFNYAVLLTERRELRAARDMLARAHADQPDFIPAGINLGSVLERLDDRVGAVTAWQNVATRLAAVTSEAVDYRCTALNQMGRVLEAARISAPAEAALRASLNINPAQPMVAQHFIALRQGQCRWPVLPVLGSPGAADLLRAISPLSLATLIDDPVFQLANAHHYHSRDGWPDGPVTAGQWPAPAGPAIRPLRIGYLSSDMREHAVGYLTAEVFSLHDRERVESFAYYCGPPQADRLQARFRATADHWCDISELTDRAAARRIVDDGIDILVDVNGYTKDGRLKMFAYRPAPVLVNWLGFPGTTGSPHHHYLIADEFIIPPGDERFYSECVRRLPCYQPNDRQRVVADEGQTRAEAGLPEDAFVFCGFNGPHKITADIFALWMDLLRDTPGSVLWLLCAEAETEEVLRSAAREAGVDPGRLVFAGRMPNAAHMARYRLADLFLDTAPYGAHTTASDALWMGVPVLTCPGNSFASRVCGSLVTAAGMGDLVCADWAEYRATALALARDQPRLAALKQRLRQGRDSSTLFNTPLLVQELETLYEQMWQDHLAGRTPVPVLDHLPAYQQIGAQAARPFRPDRASLLQWWQTRLAHRNAVQTLPRDGLLWAPALET